MLERWAYFIDVICSSSIITNNVDLFVINNWIIQWYKWLEVCFILFIYFLSNIHYRFSISIISRSPTLVRGPIRASEL